MGNKPPFSNSDAGAQMAAATAELDRLADDEYSCEAAIKEILQADKEGRVFGWGDTPKPRTIGTASLHDLVSGHLDTPRAMDATIITPQQRPVLYARQTGNVLTNHPFVSTLGAAIVVIGLAYGASNDFRTVVNTKVENLITTISNESEKARVNFGQTFRR